MPPSSGKKALKKTGPGPSNRTTRRGHRDTKPVNYIDSSDASENSDAYTEEMVASSDKEQENVNPGPGDK